LRNLFREPINLLGLSPKRHAMICLFLADSDLNSLIALPRDQLQEVAQLRVPLSPFRSAGCKDFTGGILAFEFPDSQCGFGLLFSSVEIKVQPYLSYLRSQYANTGLSKSGSADC
jgi:hypothetical protein